MSATFPSSAVLMLAQAHGATAFVETGTYLGETAAWAAQHFRVVHTIELDADRYRETAARLSPLSNVVFHQGDSRVVLPGIVHQLDGEKAVYWLDAHWSGEGTAGESDQCPLLCELACLSAQDVVLIDDARLFLSEVPAPMDRRQWPTIGEVRGAAPVGSAVSVLGDVIFVLPESLCEV